MKLYESGAAIPVRFPTGQSGAQTLATELAARLDDLTLNPVATFSSQSAPA